MVELIRTNDMVRLSFVVALLRDAGIETEVFDGHASAVEGGIIAIQRRIMVDDEDFGSARGVLLSAGEDLPPG
jgi:hypothetical protein